VHDSSFKTNSDKDITVGTAGGSKTIKLCLFLTFIAAVAFIVIQVFRPAQTPFDNAVSLVRQGKAAAALPLLEQLSMQHPANPAVFPWLAQGYLATDRIPEGRIALDTALRMGLSTSSLAPTILLYAKFYQRKGDFEEAEKLLSFLPAQSISEDLAAFYVNWADSAMANGSIAEAVAHLAKAQALVSFVSKPLAAQILHRLSDGYRKLAALAEARDKDDRAAIALLEKSLKFNDEPVTRMILANLYTRNNLRLQAIENYRAVALIDKNNLEARHHLIDLLIEAGDFDGAQKALVELMDKEKSIDNYQQLANVYLKLQNYAGAVHALEDACELGIKPEILKQLLAVLTDWSALLIKEKKLQEAGSVKGHADRVAEQLADIAKQERARSDAEADRLAAAQSFGADQCPVTLVSAHTWLASSSYTPEGEIKIKNISRRPVTDLNLKVVFFDNTTRRTSGSVNLPVASSSSVPFAESDVRTLYFSSPSTIARDQRDHQLAVRILWKNHFLREFPVFKQL
jgi:tetratricopeptide (TPR) repeat protein